MLVSKSKNTIPQDLTISINDLDITPNNPGKLFGITLDNKLNKINLQIWKLSIECTI